MHINMVNMYIEIKFIIISPSLSVLIHFVLSYFLNWRSHYKYNKYNKYYDFKSFGSSLLRAENK